MNSCFTSCLFFITFQHARHVQNPWVYHSVSLKYRVSVRMNIVCAAYSELCTSVSFSHFSCVLCLLYGTFRQILDTCSYYEVHWRWIQVKIHHFSLFSSIKYMLFLKGQFTQTQKHIYKKRADIKLLLLETAHSKCSDIYRTIVELINSHPSNLNRWIAVQVRGGTCIFDLGVNCPLNGDGDKLRHWHGKDILKTYVGKDEVIFFTFWVV